MGSCPLSSDISIKKEVYLFPFFRVKKRYLRNEVAFLMAPVLKTWFGSLKAAPAIFVQTLAMLINHHLKAIKPVHYSKS